jgi:DNA-binding IclR family transcriptional regulator
MRTQARRSYNITARQRGLRLLGLLAALQELQTQFQRVRKSGYAYDLEEHEAHIRCIAAPIWDHTGSVNASLSVTGPTVRRSNARLRQIAPLILKIGRKISEELDYQPSKKSRIRAALSPTNPSRAEMFARRASQHR